MTSHDFGYGKTGSVVAFGGVEYCYKVGNDHNHECNDDHDPDDMVMMMRMMMSTATRLGMIIIITIMMMMMMMMVSESHYHNHFHQDHPVVIIDHIGESKKKLESLLLGEIQFCTK